MSLAARIFDADSLRADGDGFELDVHLNWYRSLPLSSVATVELAVNGESISPDEITFSLNGREYRLDELREHGDEYWFVLDAATLRVGRPIVHSGEETQVGLRLGSTIPYIMVGPGEPLEQISERAGSLIAR
jgi:Domain of unknown function (DUF6379)